MGHIHQRRAIIDYMVWQG